MQIIILNMLFIIVFFIIGNYFFNIALNPNVSKKYIMRSVTQEDINEENTNKKIGERWIKVFAKEEEIISKDNIKLHGYKIVNPIRKSNVWVILVHGYMGSSYEMSGFAKEYINMGYNVFLIDLRAHGKSEGKYIGMGWKDRLDLKEWINKICTDEPECKIILYGVSRGAATVMMTTGEKLPKNVKACIEDCGYSSVYDQFKMMLESIPRFFANFILISSGCVSKIRIGYSYNEASSVKQIKKTNIPILFIHGDKDKFVPYIMLGKLYKAANYPKQRLIIENAGHVESAKINSKLYWRTVRKFINKYLK